MNNDRGRRKRREEEGGVESPAITDVFRENINYSVISFVFFFFKLIFILEYEGCHVERFWDAMWRNHH